MEKNKDEQYPWGEDTVWKERTKLAADFIPEGASVIDLGGGCEHLKEFLKTDRYISVDIKKWKPNTVVADFNKGECPTIEPKFQFVTALGVLEYMTKSGRFLKNAHKYGDKMILTYRLGDLMEKYKRNKFEFWQIRQMLIFNDWRVVVEMFVNPRVESEKLFFCVKK